MSARQILIAVIVLGLFGGALAWSLQGFVIGRLGPAGCQSGYCPPHPKPGE